MHGCIDCKYAFYDVVDLLIIPAKPLHNHDTVPVHFNHLHGDLRHTKGGLSYVHVHINQCG